MIRWRNIFAAQAALSLRTDIDTLVLRQAPRKHRASVGAHNCHERRVTYFRGWLALITIAGGSTMKAPLARPLLRRTAAQLLYCLRMLMEIHVWSLSIVIRSLSPDTPDTTPINQWDGSTIQSSPTTRWFVKTAFKFDKLGVKAEQLICVFDSYFRSRRAMQTCRARAWAAW
jgi:hypothetical protein